MARNRLHIRNFLIFSLLWLLCSGRTYAQYEVYANQLINNSTDFYNPGYSVDSDPATYSRVSNLLGVAATSYLRVRFPEKGKAGDVVNVIVRDSSGILSTSILDNITIKLYDSAGVTPVATYNGSSLLNLSLLVPGTNIYEIKFLTNPSDTFSFREVRVEFSGLVSVGLLSEFRVYGFFFQRPCPPVYADTVLASGSTPLLASTSNESRMVDANPDNYASMNTTLSLLGIGSAYIDVGFPVMAKPGDYVGFTIAASTGLLDLDILGGLSLITYDQSGTVKETVSGASTLDLKLLSGTSDRYSLGFISSSTGAYRISKIRLVKTAVVGLLSGIRVYNAFHYTIQRPPVTVSTSGSTTFCAGDSVVLSAYDSLGATNYVWNTGATTSTITVKASGAYYVEVMDSMSCTRRSIPIGVVVNAKPNPLIKGDSVLCLGSMASLNLGTATYASQLWSTGASTTSISDLAVGKYYVTVTDSNACSGADTIMVSQNTLTINPTITPATCSAGSNGAIALSVSGGSGLYTYLWSDGTASASLTGLKPGLYTCVISDNVYNCTYNKSFTVTAANVLSTKMTLVNTSGCAKTDGKINLSVQGGAGSYAYLWSNGDTTASLSGLAAGIYTVTLTDKLSGCTVSDTAALGDGGNTLVLTPSVTNTSSCSTPNGAVALSVSGGSGSYAYTWSTGATTSSVSGLKAGTYYVVVKDFSNNCSKALAVNVASSATLSFSTTVVNPGCQQKNGSLSITAVSSGSGPYTYLWNTGATTATLSSLQAGTYQVKVSDAGTGCQTEEVFTLADSSMPAATLSLTHPDCGSNGNGAITLSISGDHNVYSWSNGLNTKNISSLKPGVYTVTITDTQTNCMAVYKAELKLKSQMKIVAGPSSNTSCATAPDGAVAVTISGGLSPYSYSWSSGETVKDISGKNAGSYTLTVTDANGCSSTLTVPVQTDSAKLLNASISSITKATCNTASNGAAMVSVSGGKAPLTYAWTPGGASTKDLINVLSGSYTLTVTDAAGCTKQAIANIGIDTVGGLKGTVDSTKAAGCAASASGAVYVSISGGAIPYTYQWKKGTTVVASTKNLSSVLSGSYTLTVTDNNGCTLSLNALVGVVPSAFFVAAIDGIVKPTCDVSGDGRIYASFVGGTAPYTFSWSSGQTTKDILSVNPGTYVLTVTDSNGCSAQTTAVVEIDSAKLLTVAVDSTKDAGCLTGASGALYVTASKGNSPYSYLWTNGAISANISGLLPNTYGLTVTDSKGCKAMLNATISVDTSLSIKANIDSVEGAGCIGSKSGKVLLSVSRGVGPYTYTWSDGSTSKDLLDVTPGTYSVVIADAVGCTANMSANVGVDTAKKIILSVDSVIDASCALAANGRIYLDVKGGKMPYTYSWSNGALSADLFDVSSGLYTVTVIDANGCSSDLSTNIGIDATKAINVSALAVKDAGCSGSPSGSINISVTGGMAPYTYTWSNGATTRDISDLVPGDYTLSLKDAAGCTASFSARINVDTANLIDITADAITKAKCTGSNSGAVMVSVTGGVPPYTYLWSNGAATKDLSYVASGSYLLKVTDAIGCTAELSVNIGIDNSNPPVLSLDSIRAVGCLDTLSGAIYTSATGGVTPYSYLWSNGAITQDLIGIPVGAYALELTDDAGCHDKLSANVENAAPIMATADVKNVSCNGYSDGSAQLSATGGSGAYTYLWSDGTKTDMRSGLKAGSYTIKVSDQLSGCTDSVDINISEADSIKLMAAITKDTCLPGYDGAIDLQVTGGVSPYAYTWSNGAGSSLIQGLAPGVYTVTVTDAEGCNVEMTYTVTETDCNYQLNIHDVITPNGDGKNDLWVIEGIQFYPNSQIQIVDKWGDLVYERKGYDNSFAGVNSKNGQDLPSGTYYYVIHLNEASKAGGDNVFKGALLIQR